MSFYQNDDPPSNPDCVKVELDQPLFTSESLKSFGQNIGTRHTYHSHERNTFAGKYDNDPSGNRYNINADPPVNKYNINTDPPLNKYNLNTSNFDPLKVNAQFKQENDPLLANLEPLNIDPKPKTILGLFKEALSNFEPISSISPRIYTHRLDRNLFPENLPLGISVQDYFYSSRPCLFLKVDSINDDSPFKRQDNSTNNPNSLSKNSIIVGFLKMTVENWRNEQDKAYEYSIIGCPSFNLREDLQNAWNRKTSKELNTELYIFFINSDESQRLPTSKNRPAFIPTPHTRRNQNSDCHLCRETMTEFHKTSKQHLLNLKYYTQYDPADWGQEFYDRFMSQSKGFLEEIRKYYLDDQMVWNNNTMCDRAGSVDGPPLCVPDIEHDELYWCQVCNKGCTSPASYLNHCASKKHASNRQWHFSSNTPCIQKFYYYRGVDGRELVFYFDWLLHIISLQEM